MKTHMLGLRTVVYKVPDLTKAKKWYAKAFGKEPYFDEEFYIGYDIGGYELGLLPEKSGNSQGNGKGLAYWGVNNLEQEYSRLLELGASVFEKPENVGGDIVVAAVTDPWGNNIGLIYNPGFKVKE